MAYKEDSDVMSEDAPKETPESGGEEQHQTVEIPLSALEEKDLKPGSMIQLKVISVDSDNGVVNAVCTDYGQEGGSDELASGIEKEAK